VTIITSAEESALADGATLHVEPMPIASDATVRYRIARAEQVTIALFDMAGKERAVLFRGYAGTGETTLRLSVQALDLPSGTYSLELRTASGTAVRQLIVVVR
jgi:hypothetical protein